MGNLLTFPLPNIITYERNQNIIKMDGTYNIWMEPEHTQNGWNRFMFPNPPSDTPNWSVMIEV